MIFSFELDLDGVKMNHSAKNLKSNVIAFKSFCPEFLSGHTDANT